MTPRPRGRTVARRRARPPRRGHGYVFTGLLVGFGLGLLIAWVLAPVRYTDTAPDRLRADFKDAYRALIALAYWGNPDLVRAQSRLALLGDPNPAQALAVQAQQAQAQGVHAYEVEALRRLAADLSRAAGARLPTPPPPTPTPLKMPTCRKKVILKKPKKRKAGNHSHLRRCQLFSGKSSGFHHFPFSITNTL